MDPLDIAFSEEALECLYLAVVLNQTVMMDIYTDNRGYWRTFFNDMIFICRQVEIRETASHLLQYLGQCCSHEQLKLDEKYAMHFFNIVRQELNSRPQNCQQLFALLSA